MALNRGNTEGTITVQVHAPEFSGFTHTSADRFTYFAGSQSASRETFGLSAEDVEQLMKKFVEKLLKDDDESRKTYNLGHISPDLHNLIITCLGDISALVTSLKTGLLYADNSEMADHIAKTGHIPLILSKAASAQQYERSTRSISAFDLSTYFGKFPGAKKQAIAYLIKQQIMVKISDLYKAIQAFRATLKPNDPEFITCNKFMIRLKDEVIKVNEASMPAEYVQFDLLKTFTTKIFEMTNRMDSTLMGECLIRSIIDTLNLFQGTSVETQKNASEALYFILKDYLRTLGFGVSAKLKIAGELDDKLQQLLPIAAYLNSDLNPFARDGVFKSELITSEFHTEALNAYKSHETRHYYRETEEFVYTYERKAKPKEVFDGAQIKKLIFGTPKAAPTPKQSMLSSFSSALSLIAGGSSVSTAASSASNQRRTQLALPSPEVYQNTQYLIEGPKDEKKDETGFRLRK